MGHPSLCSGKSAALREDYPSAAKAEFISMQSEGRTLPGKLIFSQAV
jgi:hypothetical protein